LGASARLLEFYVTKTQISVAVPKVVVDEVQNLYREDLSEVNEKLVSKYRQLLANRAPQLPQLDLTQEARPTGLMSYPLSKKSCAA
jgi:hypothetical protein